MPWTLSYRAVEAARGLEVEVLDGGLEVELGEPLEPLGSVARLR